MNNGGYQYLKPKRGSRYQQLFCGRIRAEVLYREAVGRDPLSPEEVAREYQVPVEAVREAIDYCLKNKDLLDAERAREEAATSLPAATSGRMPPSMNLYLDDDSVKGGAIHNLEQSGAPTSFTS